MYDIIIFVSLLILGYVFGTFAEKKHFRSIREREEELKTLPTIMLKRPLKSEKIKECRLVNGSVVISIDFFKKFIAGIINLFGGNVTVYETLLDRARREAIDLTPLRCNILFILDSSHMGQNTLVIHWHHFDKV